MKRDARKKMPWFSLNQRMTVDIHCNFFALFNTLLSIAHWDDGSGDTLSLLSRLLLADVHMFSSCNTYGAYKGQKNVLHTVGV